MAEREFRHIVRVINTDLDGNKKIVSALRKIKGVSFSFASAACITANVAKDAKTGELTDEEINRLNEAILNAPKNLPLWMLNRRKDYETGADRHVLTSDLDFTRLEDIKRMQRVKSYKGMRHSMGLPVRGQRTRSNFRRNKGKVLGVVKKKIMAQKSGGDKADKGAKK